MKFDKVIEVLKFWERCGIRKTQNGSLLICHVPHVALEAWLHEIYYPLSQEKISKLENQLQKGLPSELIQFYGIANGLNIFSDSLSIWGLRESYERVGDGATQPYDIVALNEENSWYSPKGWLFFGGYSWDGSQMVYDLISEKQAVARVENGSTKILQEWPDFWNWLINETQRLAKLFDFEGKVLDSNMPTIPS